MPILWQRGTNGWHCLRQRHHENGLAVTQNPARERTELLKIQQERERSYSKSSKREKELRKNKQEREKELLKNKQEKALVMMEAGRSAWGRFRERGLGRSRECAQGKGDRESGLY